MHRVVRRALASRSGTTALEYALVAGTLSIAIATAVSLIGANVEALYRAVLAGF